MDAEGKTIIGSIGRVAAQKNPLFALDVIKEVVKHNSSVEDSVTRYRFLGIQHVRRTQKAGMDLKTLLLNSRVSMVLYVLDKHYFGNMGQTLIADKNRQDFENLKQRDLKMKIVWSWKLSGMHERRGITGGEK